MPLVSKLTRNLLAHILTELALVVASRIILAHDIEPLGLVLTAAALLPPTAHGSRILPHYLCEVAGVHRETGRVPVVLLPLRSPHVDESTPAGEAGAAGEVLPNTLLMVVSISHCVAARVLMGGDM